MKAATIERNSRVQITPFDRHCWGYSRSGLDTTAIATIMNATPEEVTQAITALEKWKATNSMDIVVASMNEQALIAMEPVGTTLAEAQAARRLVSPAVINPTTGEIMREAEYAPDYTTRIAATEAVARIVESVREKGPGVQVNLGGQHIHANGGGATSFEDRVRIKREELGIDRVQPKNAVDVSGDGNIIEGEDIDDDDDDAGDYDDDTEEYEEEGK